jgi:hypothetical protein
MKPSKARPAMQNTLNAPRPSLAPAFGAIGKAISAKSFDLKDTNLDGKVSQQEEDAFRAKQRASSDQATWQEKRKAALLEVWG